MARVKNILNDFLTLIHTSRDFNMGTDSINVSYIFLFKKALFNTIFLNELRSYKTIISTLYIQSSCKILCYSIDVGELKCQ